MPGINWRPKPLSTSPSGRLREEGTLSSCNQRGAKVFFAAGASFDRHGEMRSIVPSHLVWTF